MKAAVFLKTRRHQLYYGYVRVAMGNFMPDSALAHQIREQQKPAEDES